MVTGPEKPKFEELPQLDEVEGDFDIGGLEFNFFDTSLRRSFLEDSPSSIGNSSNTGTSFPASPATGNIFFRTDTKKFYIYDGDDWLLIGGKLNTKGNMIITGRYLKE